MPHEEDQRSPGDRARMLHMLEAAQQALTFAKGRNRGDLDDDDMLRRAVKDCVQEIGEAASKVTQAGRDRSPDVPWRKIVGMRHRIVHVYFDVDTGAMWEVISRDLNPLIAALEATLADWPPHDWPPQKP